MVSSTATNDVVKKTLEGRGASDGWLTTTNDRGDDHREVERRRQRREHGPPQPLPPDRGALASERLVVTTEELEVGEHGHETVDVDLLAVRRFVPAFGVQHRSAGIQLAYQCGSIRGEHPVGVDVAPANDNLVAFGNEGQTMKSEHGCVDRERHDSSPPRSSACGGPQGALRADYRQNARTQQQQP